MKYTLLILLFIFLLISAFSVFAYEKSEDTPMTAQSIIKPIFSPTPTPIPLAKSKILENNYHVFQTFNNCGPASLSMALSYFGINKTQDELGSILRPFQNPQGDNDDKSVTFDEMAKLSQTYGLYTYHRPNGSIDLLKQFIANDIPVLTRTWLHVNEDIGHYRVVKGYDDTSQIIIQDDSYEDKNLSFSYDDFNTMWEKYNYEYLVLVTKEKKIIAETILGKNIDKHYAWKETIIKNEEKLQNNPGNIYTLFNLSIAYYHTGNYKKAIELFEQIENTLPFRTLWYQIEPILAYQKTGNYEKVFTLTNRILYNQNRAFSELYIIRGNIYKTQGNIEAARVEYENAVFYNENLAEAQDALNSL